MVDKKVIVLKVVPTKVQHRDRPCVEEHVRPETMTMPMPMTMTMTMTMTVREEV